VPCKKKEEMEEKNSKNDFQKAILTINLLEEFGNWI